MAASAILSESKNRAEKDRQSREAQVKRHNRAVELHNQREDWHRSYRCETRYERLGEKGLKAYAAHMADSLIEFVGRAKRGDGYGSFDEIDYGDGDAGEVVREIYSLASKRRRKALAQYMVDLLDCDKPLRDEIDKRVRFAVTRFLIYGPQPKEDSTTIATAQDPEIVCENSWSGFHSPDEWRKAWEVSETTWRKFRNKIRCDQHPVSKSKRVRFLVAELQRMGLIEPTTNR
jgi:hypothetical protein